VYLTYKLLEKCACVLCARFPVRTRLVQQFNYITVGISLNYVNATADNIIITIAVYLCVIFVGVLRPYRYIYNIIYTR